MSEIIIHPPVHGGFESAYADRVATYGRHWHRPWTVLLFFSVVPWALSSLTWENAEAPVACECLLGSRFRAAVKIDGLAWTADLDAALACARKHGRHVLVAFHGIMNINAYRNETKVFHERQVKTALARYVLVMLHTDIAPDNFYRQNPDEAVRIKDAEANQKFEQKHFQTEQEPLYVILQPKANGDFEIVAEYDEARINDVDRFERFLRNPRNVPLLSDRLRSILP